jgi:hypothetical protein
LINGIFVRNEDPDEGLKGGIGGAWAVLFNGWKGLGNKAECSHLCEPSLFVFVDELVELHFHTRFE